MLGDKKFSQNFIEELIIDGMDLGIAIIDIGTSFAVIELSVLEGFRNVPPAVIEKIAK